MASRYPGDMTRDYKPVRSHLSGPVCDGRQRKWYAAGTAGVVGIMAVHLPQTARILEDCEA